MYMQCPPTNQLYVCQVDFSGQHRILPKKIPPKLNQSTMRVVGVYEAGKCACRCGSRQSRQSAHEQQNKRIKQNEKQHQKQQRPQQRQRKQQKQLKQQKQQEQREQEEQQKQQTTSPILSVLFGLWHALRHHPEFQRVCALCPPWTCYVRRGGHGRIAANVIGGDSRVCMAYGMGQSKFTSQMW